MYNGARYASEFSKLADLGRAITSREVSNRDCAKLLAEFENAAESANKNMQHDLDVLRWLPDDVLRHLP
jgi:hypothetical protein